MRLDFPIIGFWLLNGRAQFCREAGIPCLAMLGAQALSAGRLFLSELRGYVDEKLLALEPFTVERSFHLGGYFFLKLFAEERWFFVRKANAIRRAPRLYSDCILGRFKSFYQSSCSHGLMSSEVPLSRDPFYPLVLQVPALLRVSAATSSVPLMQTI
jgi:hypothetical protein